jgi:hypothetical protein
MLPEASNGATLKTQWEFKRSVRPRSARFFCYGEEDDGNRCAVTVSASNTNLPSVDSLLPPAPLGALPPMSAFGGHTALLSTTKCAACEPLAPGEW